MRHRPATWTTWTVVSGGTSALNRAHPKKHDAFVLDFNNDADTIQDAFADYYRTTVLAEETDPDRLHDLKAALDGYQVYAPVQLDELVERYLSGADRDQLDPILDACVSLYREQLDEDGQVDFKGKAQVRSSGPTGSWPQSCPTPTPSGRNFPSS